MKGGIIEVTDKTVGDVQDWEDGLEEAYEKFEKWLAAQEFGFNERQVAQGIFDVRFSSLSGSRLFHLDSLQAGLGEKRVKEIYEAVKKFAVEAGLCTVAEFEEGE